MRLPSRHLTSSLLGRRAHGEVAGDPVLGGEGDLKGQGREDGRKTLRCEKLRESQSQGKEETGRIWKADSPRKWTKGTRRWGERPREM